MIDIHVAADGANDAAKDGITIFPKLGDNIYKAASAEDSFNIALKEYRDKLKEINDPHSHYMGTLEVIREAQRKNVKIHDEATDSYGRYKTAAGEVGIYIKDNKDAYIKMGEAANTASDDVNKYMGTTKDSIKIISDNTIVLKDNKPAFDNVSTAAKNASDEVNKYMGVSTDNIQIVKESTEEFKYLKPAIDDVSESAKISTGKMDDYMKATDDVKNAIPPMNEEIKSISDYMKDTSESVSDSAETMRDEFKESKWTLDGVKKGLGKSFENAFDSIKQGFKGLFDWINDKLNIEVKGEKINIGRVGYATGGFPEDGMFFANHTELVGKFSNGKTAVANNEQIVKGIENGVYNAVMSAMSNNNSGSSYISNEIIVDGEVIARSVTKAQEKINRRYSPQTT